MKSGGASKLVLTMPLLFLENISPENFSLVLTVALGTPSIISLGFLLFQFSKEKPRKRFLIAVTSVAIIFVLITLVVGVFYIVNISRVSIKILESVENQPILEIQNISREVSNASPDYTHANNGDQIEFYLRFEIQSKKLEARNLEAEFYFLGNNKDSYDRNNLTFLIILSAENTNEEKCNLWAEVPSNSQYFEFSKCYFVQKGQNNPWQEMNWAIIPTTREGCYMTSVDLEEVHAGDIVNLKWSGKVLN